MVAPPIADTIVGLDGFVAWGLWRASPFATLAVMATGTIWYAERWN